MTEYPDQPSHTWRELRDTIREINVRLGNCDPLEDATRPELDEGFDDRSYLASTDEMLDRLEADMVEESPTPDEARSSARTSPGADGRQAPTPTVNVPHVVYDQKMPPYHYQKPEFGSGSVSAPTQPEPAQEPDEVFSELARHIWNDGGLLNTSIIKEILANLPSLLRTPEAIAEIKRQGWVEASVVEAERENIVAWLRDQSRDPMLPEYAEFLSAFVDAILALLTPPDAP